MKRVETESLTLAADGFILIVHGAPEERNRYDSGIHELLRRSRVTQNITCTWNDLREYGFSVRILVDPLDDPAEDDRVPGGGWDRRRWEPASPYR
jgi:hypothetical protein